MNVDAITPVLAGCHPDPSVCRVGDDYFMVTSTFAFFPGLPVHRSGDLRAWDLVGHVLADPDHVDLIGLDTSDGVWAPTIRHHRGRFFVVFTVAENRRGKATYLTTASAASGPWTPPVELTADGIDPSLFFDDDGRCWFTAARDARDANATGPAEIWLREFDPATLSLVGDEHVLWHGAVADTWVEAPHIFKRHDRYVLIAAEGGTERNHAVTAAHASVVTGPYHTDPRSPLLTHRHLDAEFPVQNVGHADLVDTPDGRTFALMLGVRLRAGVHVLGREVFLCEVEWDAAGPVFSARGGHLPVLRKNAIHVQAASRDWVSLRAPVEYELEDSRLAIAPRPDALSGRGAPGLIGVRQDRHEMRISAIVSAPTPGQFTSLVALQGQDRFVEIGLERREGEIVVETALFADGRRSALEVRRGHSQEQLAIVTGPDRYQFGTLDGSQFFLHASVAARTLSTEDAGGFVGVLLGFAHRGASGSAWAYMDDLHVGELDAYTAPRRSRNAELRRAINVGAII